MATDERPLADAAWLRAVATRHVLDALSAGGAPVRFVGGCVRDTLCDPSLDTVDLDLATPLPPERNIELLTEAGIRTLPTGIAHGTITALADGRDYEITTLRQDIATDGRRAVVAFTDCFVADAARRDFTFNAMSSDADGRVFDPFDGRADLAAGRVRFVGDPEARIREDYLRILRFFRFLARFGKEPPDEATCRALRANRAGLDRLSPERLQAELFKLLVAPSALAAVRLMNELDIWQQLFGAKADTTRLQGLLAADPAADAMLRLIVLIRGRTAALVVRQKLRLGNRDAERLESFERQATAHLLPLDLSRAAIWRHAYRSGIGPVRDRLLLSAAETGGGGTALQRSLAALDRFERPRLPVTGHDLMAHGVLPGPPVGIALRKLEDLWIESDFTLDRPSLLAKLADLETPLGDDV